MKKFITVVSILLVVAAVSFGTPIPNGSFTDCTPTASNNCVFADTENSKFLLTGDTSLDGWTVTSGGVKWVRSWAATPSGAANGWDTSATSNGDGLTNSIHLNTTTDNVVSSGAMAYDLSSLGLVNGQLYSIQFLMSGAPAGAVLGTGGDHNYGEVFMNVQVSNGLPGPYAYSYQSDSSKTQMHWELNLYNFVYDSAAGFHTLSFQSTTTGSSFGPALDGIAVVDRGVPEPGTLSMLLGAGLLLGGFFLKSRRS